MKRAINDTFEGLAFDPTLFPVPDENLLTFCNKLDTSSIDTFKQDLIDIARYGTIIIIGLAFIITGLNCILIWYRWRSLQGHFDLTRQAWESDPILNPNVSSPSAPLVTNPSNGNSMTSPPVFPSEPQATLGDGNTTMSQPAFPSAPQAHLGDRNITMSQHAIPPAPYGNDSDPDLKTSQPAFPFAPQVTPSDGKYAFPPAPYGNVRVSDPDLKVSPPDFPSPPQVAPSNGKYAFPPAPYSTVRVSDPDLKVSLPPFPSAPQVTPSNGKYAFPPAPYSNVRVSDPDEKVSLPAFPSAPQVTSSKDNITMSESHPVFPSPPQATLGEVSDHILKMSQKSAPSGNVSDHISTTSKASLPQGNVSDQNLKMLQPAFPSAPQVTPTNGNLMMSESRPVFPFTPQATLGDVSDHISTMSQGYAPSGNASDHVLTTSKASVPQSGNASDQNLTMSQAAPAVPQMTLSNHNLMMLQVNSEHPLITRIIFMLEARLGLTTTQNLDMRWFFHYVFHPPALACFLIGFFGLLSVMIQLFLLGPLLAAAREGVEVAIADISNIIVNAINNTMYNQSATYANGVNSKVDVVQNAINHGLFGWVNGTTSLLNNTINHFYTDVQNYVTHLFNGTVLKNPMLDFLQCVIGNKVVDIGEAFTFLQDNLVIDLPRVSQDVLVLSSRSVDEATGPIASGAVGSGSGGDDGLLGDAIAVYQKSLMAEAQIFGIFMGLWGIVVLSAVCILLWRIRKRKKALEAAKLQVVKTELQMPVPAPVPVPGTLDSEKMKENNSSFSSFPNDEKKDPFMDD